MRLLLIEDYKPLQKSLVKGLREANFAVDYTGDGREGLWYAKSNDYDVIILDIMLPGLDGLSILRELRALGDATHILILTAKDTLEDKVRGLELGADDYLIKPFEFEELIARLRALIRRDYKKKSPQLTIDDLTIDMNTQQVHRDGRLLCLTAREYALLEYLALRAGEVVTRTDIWEHVYEFNSAASSNVVDVYIGYLRKKVERQGKPALIHTIRGRGYLVGIKK
jgi:two-component system copper resistance phosphate regulon response regulator CusR